jgi:hypothetical protein
MKVAKTETENETLARDHLPPISSARQRRVGRVTDVKAFPAVVAVPALQRERIQGEDGLARLTTGARFK